MSATMAAHEEFAEEITGHKARVAGVERSREGREFGEGAGIGCGLGHRGLSKTEQKQQDDFSPILLKSALHLRLRGSAGSHIRQKKADVGHPKYVGLPKYLGQLNIDSGYLWATASARICSAWPSGLTFRHTCAMVPLGVMRKVVRSMPITFLPYMFFSLSTS